MAKKNYDSLLQQYQNGKGVTEILKENPNVTRATLYYRIKQAGIEPHQKRNPKPEEDSEAPQSPEPAEANGNDNEKFSVQEQNEPKVLSPVMDLTPDDLITQTVNSPTIAPVQRPQRVVVVDDALSSFQTRGPSGSSKSLPWSSNNELDGLLGEFMATQKPSYNPRELSKPSKKPDKSDSKDSLISGLMRGFGKKQPQTKREVDQEEMEEEENARLEAIQKIRLYFHYFPQLKQLHFIPRKGEEVTDKEAEKYLISLYTAKQADLDKTLHYLKFHCRNQIGEHTTAKMGQNILTTVTKISEHILCMSGLKCKGLTEEVTKDEDIQRCINEIMIDHSVQTLSFGPKTDLAMKIGMKILQTDSTNRIEERIENEMKKKLKQDKEDGTLAKPPIKPEDSLQPVEAVSSRLKDKYSDL